MEFYYSVYTCELRAKRLAESRLSMRVTIESLVWFNATEVHSFMHHGEACEKDR